jgi:sterol-4alpha-carboxylate 3-dehydrogenase (decarboxylating)
MDSEEKLLGSVLVVGGTGFIGRHIVDAFLNEPSCTAVHVLSRTIPKDVTPNVEYLEADIRNFNELKRTIDEINPRTITNLACPGYPAGEKELQEVIVQGNSNILRCAVENDAVKAYIFASSAEVVRRIGKELNEETAEVWSKQSKDFSTISLWAKAKAIAETMTLKANGTCLNTTALRMQAVYGEGESGHIKAHFMNMRNWKENFQLGDDTCLFSFMYVKSAARAYVLAAKALVEGRQDPNLDGEAYFVSDGVSTPFWGFARKVYAAAGHRFAKQEVRVTPFWVLFTIAAVVEGVYWLFARRSGTGRVPLSVAEVEYLRSGVAVSIEKARVKLGYEPLVDQEEGIRRSVKWALENGEGLQGNDTEKERVSRV